MMNYVIKDRVSTLTFHKVTVADVPVLAHYMSVSSSRACDCSVGGVTMWADYFRYELAVYRDTLFIKGLCEDDLRCPAFSVPIGRHGGGDGVDILREYCHRNGAVPLVLSAVPEDLMPGLNRMTASVDELSDWADYLYDIDALADLTGNRYSKKRNHVNRFVADNPGFTFSRLVRDDIPDVIDFYRGLDNHDGELSVTAAVEREQVFNVLNELSLYPFDGGVLRLADGRIVAFTLGEVVGDTLMVHIEKMCHDVNGAGETVNRCFAAMMRDRCPGLRWVNREEDVGDPGLRRAKESYHPAMMLRKYNVRIG